MFGACNISLSFDDHYQTRDTNLKLLWENEEFLDVTLVCDDDQVKAHKVILSAASPFFRQIFTQNPHNHPLLYLRGTSRKIIQSLLNYIYSGETSVKQDELATFMSLAESLKVHGLAGEFSEKVEEDRKEPIQNEIRYSDVIEKEEKIFESRTNTSFENPITSSKTSDQTFNEIDDIAQENEYVDKYSEDHNQIMNTDEEEYDKRMAELMMKNENGKFEWMCKKCPYRSKNKAHVQEHVQKHILGFAIKCKYCEKTFKMKMYIRQHVRMCHKEMVRPAGRVSQVRS